MDCVMISRYFLENNLETVAHFKKLHRCNQLSIFVLINKVELGEPKELEDGLIPPSVLVLSI